MTYLKTNKLEVNRLQSSIILCMQDNSRRMHQIIGLRINFQSDQSDANEAVFKTR